MSEPEINDPVQDLFDRAVDLPLAERTAFLDAACRNQPTLRAEVEGLLAYDQPAAAPEADLLLQSPFQRPASAAPAPPRPSDVPERIGHYRILHCLGQGGMGVVYEAEQENPRRLVALKVIRPGLVTPSLRSRFVREVQILGRLHHSGIAQIYEAGLAEDDRPFFAMELIRGLPLDHHTRRLPEPTDRLVLMARVCEAVQHAHEQGVVHRDLKPSNILIDETGAPRIVDFGVAHLSDDEGPAGGRTQTGQLLGTPLYMSPEQVHGAAVDRRSDVYALGVILFELLAEQMPYCLDPLPLPEAARTIREQEPRQLGSIHSRYRGDVETIVGKALEKDPARRYASAGELADDIRRHLNNEPIRARPPSALYQLRKFTRRHAALVGGTAAFFAAVIAGLVGTILFAVQAEHNAVQAKANEAQALDQAYRARVAAAAAALTGQDVIDTARQLAEAPEARRGWEWRHLHSRLDDSFAVLSFPSDESLQLVPAADGVRIAAVSAGRVRLLDLDGREQLSQPLETQPVGILFDLRSTHGPRRLEVRDDFIRSTDLDGRSARRWQGLANMLVGPQRLSPDGSLLAVGWSAKEARTRHDWVITLWSTDGPDRPALRFEPGSYVTDLAFSPDGTRLVSAQEDGTARLWDVASGAALATCRGHRTKVLSVAFRPDGQRLATGSADATVRQWDPATGQEVEPLYERHTGEVHAIAYSPDGTLLASAGVDRTVRLWHSVGRQEVEVLLGHTTAVHHLAFTPDGRQLVSVQFCGTVGRDCDEARVRLWDVTAEASSRVLRGHTSYIYPTEYSPDGRWIASGSWDRTVRLWDAETGEACAVLGCPNIVRALSFLPGRGTADARLIVCCDYCDRLLVWDAATGQRLPDLPGPGPHPEAVAVSPDGAQIVAVDRDGRFRVVDAGGGEIASWTVNQIFGGKPALAYSPDGRLLAASAGEKVKAVDLYDARTFRRGARLTGYAGPVSCAAFSPDGRRLVSGGRDRDLRVHDVASGECLAVLHGHTDVVFALAFHPDGKRLASGGRDRSVWLWDPASAQEVVRLPGHTNYVFSLAFSPDGKTLASGSGDGTVRLWDTVPLRSRYQAQRQAEALRPAAERLVGRLFAQKQDAAAVVAALRGEAMEEPLRQEALRAVLRRGNK